MVEYHHYKNEDYSVSIHKMPSLAMDPADQCDPPKPDIMTEDEMHERLKLTGDPLKDKKLALELSIENHKRKKAWFELLGSGPASEKSGSA